MLLLSAHGIILYKVILTGSKGPDQTGWMYRLIWAFAVPMCLEDLFSLGVAHLIQGDWIPLVDFMPALL